MLKNRVVIISLMLCVVLGTIPFALGATAPTTNNVYISALYVGAPHQTVNQEYVKITNKGTTAVSMRGWKVTDKGAKHTYKFPSTFVLKSKNTVTLYTGKGKNTSTKLFWGRAAFVWNNEGDTAYLYNAQGKLVSTKVWLKQK
jgi:Lamin Tail Domain